MATQRWLAVGLGNPEPKYAGTRHNIGADVVRTFAARHSTTLSRHKRARGELAEVTLAGARVVLYVADTFMNTSGGPVQAAASWFKVPLERLIVCHDDLDLPLGAIRLKRGGGNAGHNGLADIQRAFGSADYLRIRVGISRPPQHIPGRDYVLGRFTADEAADVDTACERAGDALTTLVTDGLEAAQNAHNSRA